MKTTGDPPSSVTSTGPGGRLFQTGQACVGNSRVYPGSRVRHAVPTLALPVHTTPSMQQAVPGLGRERGSSTPVSGHCFPTLKTQRGRNARIYTQAMRVLPVLLYKLIQRMLLCRKNKLTENK